MRKAVIIGAGTQGQVYASYLKEAGINLIGFIDDNPDLEGKEVLGLSVLGKFNDLFLDVFKTKIDDVYCPIGVNSVRVKYLSTLKKEGYQIPNFIHPSVSIAPDVEIGEGVYMLVNNIIMPHTKIGNYVMINMDSTIAHHVDLADGVFLSSGVNIGASINVRKNAYIGMGVTIMTGINEVGKETLLGAGTVIIKDIPNYATMVGNPGRMIKNRYSDICFVGSGISSSFSLLNFLDLIDKNSKINEKISINIIEKYSEFSTGVPYGSRSGFTTLLITSLKDFLIEPERIKFVGWLNKNKIWLLDNMIAEGGKLTEKWLNTHKNEIDNNDWDNIFIPRRFFGCYLEQRIKTITEKLTKRGVLDINYIQGEVIDIEKTEDVHKVFIKNNLPYFSKKVILSVGSMPTKHLWKNQSVIELPNLLFLNNPYHPELSETLKITNKFLNKRSKKTTNILVVGANASALEMLYKLNDYTKEPNNYNFVFLSTQGRLPDGQIDESRKNDFTPINLNNLKSETELTAKIIADATYKDLALADGIALGPATSVNIISSAFGSLLNKLGHEELKKFACLYGNDIGRQQRCAGLHYLNNIKQLENENRFKHIAGRFLDLKHDSNSNEYKLEYLDTSTKTTKTYNQPFHLIVNCVGGKNLTQTDIPDLFKNIISKKYGIPNESKIGFQVNEKLEASDNLYIMGPLLAGNVIENKAVWHVEHCGRIIWLSKILSKILYKDFYEEKDLNNDHYLEIKGLENKIELETYKNIVKKEWKNNIYYAINHIKYFENKTNTLKYFIFSKNNKPLILMPFILRSIIITNNESKSTYFDAMTPYGYSGPLFNTEEVNNNDLIEFWKAVDLWYKKNNVITEFVRFNLSNNYKNYNGKLIITSNNVKGALTSFDEVWCNLKQKVRNNYRKALKNELSIKIHNNTISKKTIDDFYIIFLETMRRNGAKKNYLYTKTYFENIIKNHLEETYIATVLKNNVTISVELIFRVEDTIYSYLGGTLSEYFSLRPNDFLKIEVMKWAIENKIKYYVLGGGIENEDSLYKYKKSFFPKDKDVIFYTGRKVVNEEVYTELVKSVIEDVDTPQDCINNPSIYFPIYNQNYFKKIEVSDFEELLKK